MHGENKEFPTETEVDDTNRSNFSDENLEVSIDRSFVYPVLPTENGVHSSRSLEPPESLLEKSKLFYQKLREFHESSGLSLVASVAGSVLDLYMLYAEVTRRGGFARVTMDGRWSEVASAVDFTSRIPKPSFQLQELYADLLYQFELIYFFGTHGKPAAPPVSVDPGSQVGNTVVGVIETEFDSGYLITVTVNSEKLNGLLYHIEDSAGEQFAIVPSLMDGVGLEDSDSEPVGLQIQVGSAKREPTAQSSSKKETKLKPTVESSSKKEMKKKDPEAPRGIRSAYQFFLCKECDRLKKMHGESLGRNIRKRVIDAWKCLSENNRLPYVEESRKDKERFDREMVAYKERRNMQTSKAEHKSYNPDQEMVAYKECGNMQTSKAEHKSYNPEASVAPFQDVYHVSLQAEETDKLLELDESMVELAVQLMENARQLDATLQIGLDNCCGSLDISI